MYSIDTAAQYTAEQQGGRITLTDEKFIKLVENALDRERRRLKDDSLAEGFAKNVGTAGGAAAGSPEGDWFMIAEKALGFEDDYAAYISACEPQGDLSPTEAARRAITERLLTGGGTDFFVPMPEYEPSELAVNEIIWTGTAERLCGSDYAAYLDELISRQNPDGSFGMRGDSDPDLTAMSLILLPKESEAAVKALGCLSEMWQSGEITNCEAAAWCIIGCCSQDICPNDTADFTAANGRRPIDLLAQDCLCRDGGFSHLPNDDDSAALPTEQALLALAALAEYNAGGGGLFDEITVDTDIYSQHKISGESFDEFDEAAARELSASTSNIEALWALHERANYCGATDEQKALVEGKLTEITEKHRVISELNLETTEFFYPPESVGFSKLRQLTEHNRRAAEVAEEDRSLLLAADELILREKRLKTAKACGLGGLAVLIAAAVIIKVNS
jgi:hypothetical protein